MGCFWWCQLGKEINLMLASVCYQVSLQSSWQYLRPQFALCMTSPNGKNTPLSVLHCHMMRFRQFVPLMFFSYSWGEALNVSADSYHSLRKKIEPFVLFFPMRGEHGRATHTHPHKPPERRGLPMIPQCGMISSTDGKWVKIHESMNASWAIGGFQQSIWPLKRVWCKLESVMVHR